MSKREHEKQRKRDWADSQNPSWWPSYAQAIFAAIGRAMRGSQLYPQTLLSIPAEFGSVLPNHRVVITHVSGKSLNRRKGYQIDVEGPLYAGHWQFVSGQLERLSRSASEM